MKSKLSRSLFAALLGSVCALALAAPAGAEFGVRPDPGDPSVPDFHVSLLQSDGVTPFTQAGGHPYEMRTSFQLNRLPDESPDGRMKDQVVDLPAGIVGDPTAAPKCTFVQIANSGNNSTGCPIQAHIGIVALTQKPGPDEPPSTGFLPLFNMVPLPGDVATMAFNAGANQLTTIHFRVRSEPDYGIRAIVDNASTFLHVLGAELIVWGVPADPAHDPFRGPCLFGDGTSLGLCPAGMEPAPFLSTGTDCSAGPQAATMQLSSWAEPDDVKSYVSNALPPVDGCEKLLFEPSLTFQPEAAWAGVPSGATSVLSVPENDTVAGVSTPPLRKAVVTLPEGVAISPSSANGLTACSDAQLGVGSDEPSACPDSSKVATARIESPVLDDPLEGSVFVGEQLPDQTFRVFLEAAGPGVRVKQVGDIDPDPDTGQITLTFDETPQLPSSELKLSFFGGPHASLSLPRACGTYTTTGQLTPWSAPTTPVASTGDQFSVTRGFGGGACGPAGFDPELEAGTVSPVAGEHSPFTLTLSRGDGDQFLDGLSVDMPAGLLARIAAVPELCSDAQAAAGTCGEGSRVGSATTGAGPGSDPFFLPGRAYLTGPYKGAPYGLAVVVPAKAGPFDLGTVVVRSALFLDRRTAQARVVSDPFPRILDGVPLQIRTVNVHVDRDGFMVNPTSCQPTEVNAQATSTDGATAQLASRFQVGGCASLGFSPKLAMRLLGKGRTRSGTHPALRAVLTQPAGQANIAGARVTLPRSLALDAKNAFDPAILCGYDAAERSECPRSSVIGRAKLDTPLLGDPLTGPVHLVQGIKFGPTGNRIRTLPTLLVKLRGDVAIDLRSRTAVDGRSRLVSVFPNVPDAPASRFSLKVNGGPKGILVITENRRGTINLCAARQRAIVETDGHNGKANDYPITVKTPCPRNTKPQRLRLRRNR